MSEEALTIAVKRTEVKGKGEKERYTHLNAECQRIARRDKKVFLSDQCKEIEENNRMEKTRDLFKKIIWRRKWQPTPVFLPGESHGQRCLTGYSSWGLKSQTRLSDLKKKKKIRDTKGRFHAKMGTIKDRNGMDLTEAEDIKKRWQEHPEELYQRDLLEETGAHYRVK